MKESLHSLETEHMVPKGDKQGSKLDDKLRIFPEFCLESVHEVYVFRL